MEKVKKAFINYWLKYPFQQIFILDENLNYF